MSLIKLCPKCKERPRAISRNGKMAPYCRECNRILRRESSKQYHIKNRDKIIERQRESRRKDPERFREYRRNWFRKHPEKVRETNDKWRKANKEKHNEFLRRRRARMYGCQKIDMDINLISVGNRDKWVCKICGIEITKNRKLWRTRIGPSIDHIIPLCKGGTHTWDNVQLAHRSCNSSKGTSSQEEHAKKEAHRADMRIAFGIPAVL